MYSVSARIHSEAAERPQTPVHRVFEAYSTTKNEIKFMKHKDTVISKDSTLLFGDIIREARMQMRPSLSLRKLAWSLDIAPAYLSRIENNLDRSPSAKVVEHLAEILGFDKYELLRIARRTPTEFEQAFASDIRAPKFLWIAMSSGFSPEELEQIIIEYRARQES